MSTELGPWVTNHVANTRLSDGSRVSTVALAPYQDGFETVLFSPDHPAGYILARYRDRAVAEKSHRRFVAQAEYVLDNALSAENNLTSVIRNVITELEKLL